MPRVSETDQINLEEVLIVQMGGAVGPGWPHEHRMTDHATKRFRQRGLNQIDLKLIEAFATDTEDGLFMSKKDVARAQEFLKMLLGRVSRLKNTFVCLKGSKILTAHHVDNRAQQHWKLRGCKSFKSVGFSRAGRQIERSVRAKPIHDGLKNA